MYENLGKVREEAMQCTKCALAQTRRHVVFGEGNLQAKLMFVGEGPGATEDETGRPFVGPAGQLLDKMLAAIDLKREDVYIANIVKCRPPGNAAGICRTMHRLSAGAGAIHSPQSAGIAGAYCGAESAQNPERHRAHSWTGI